MSEVIVWEDNAMKFVLNDRNSEEFFRKFGPKIKYFHYRGKIDWSLFPNIEKLIISGVTLSHYESIISQLILAKLKELELIIDQGQEHVLHTVIDTFPTLTHLSVVIKSRDENVIYKSLKNISKLKHLVHFKLHIQLPRNNELFFDLLKQMSNICLNLKSIDFHILIDKNSEIRQFFSLLKAFPALKRLNLWLNFVDNEGEDSIDFNQLFSFELFKGFENITHLTLCFNLRQTLKESILKDIDINLPKLQYLEITDTFDITSEVVTQMSDILSRLSRLETLKLYFKSGVDFKPIEEQITNKCRKIRKIEIKISNF